MKSISPKQFFVQSFLQNPKHQKITQQRYFTKTDCIFEKNFCFFVEKGIKSIDLVTEQGPLLFCIHLINMIFDVSPQPPPPPPKKNNLLDKHNFDISPPPPLEEGVSARESI